MLKLDASGIAIMSDSSIGLKPVIDEPSKPIPPSNASSSSEALIEKLFSWPRTSVNQSRMKRMSRSVTTLRTSSAFSVWIGLSSDICSSARCVVPREKAGEHIGAPGPREAPRGRCAFALKSLYLPAVST